MNKNEFNSFFKLHSKNVDKAERQGFWLLTDNLLETYLLEFMTKRNNVTIIDFGGGTGRWLKKLDKYFTNSTFILVDLSDDMLEQARKKQTSENWQNELKIIKSDISNIKNLKNETADYIISTYNPLSFVNDPSEPVSEAMRLLKAGGTAMITVQGFYNAIYSKINNSLAECDELSNIANNKKVKWNDYVPNLWQLSKEDMHSLFTNAGFKSVKNIGIACVTQPEPEDFDPTNKQIGKLSHKLNTDKRFYKTLFDIEYRAGKTDGAVNRGMNILTVGVK